MEQIELVIKMPKEYYDLLMSGRFYLCGARGNGKTVTSEVMKSIGTGTVLPKGHGRIGDFDIAEEWLEDGYMLDDVPALLEADKEGAEK